MVEMNSTNVRNRALPTRPMKITFFRALPDPPLVRATITPAGTFAAKVPNSVVLSAQAERALANHLETMWLDFRNLPKKPLQHDVLNACGDADCYAAPLEWLNGAAEAAGVRVFNHPAEVAKTRRDVISRLLAPVSGLIVPVCVRFQADSMDAFVRTFRQHGFRFPVLVRPAGSQTGRDLLRIDHENDWAKLQTIGWFGKIFYMTQFVDFQNEQGNYVKLRVSNCGRQFIVKHVKIGNTWKVHNATSDGDVATREANLDKFSSDAELKRIVTAIREIVRLDYWGIDLGYNGKYTFFEGNPAMTMLGKAASPAPPPGSNGPEAKVIRKEVLTNFLINHILSPGQWLHHAA